MVSEWLILAVVINMTMASLFLILGYMFGLIAIPTLYEQSRQKYLWLIVAILIPPVCMGICLYHYTQTRYASRFVILGLIFTALTLALVAFYGDPVHLTSYLHHS